MLTVDGKQGINMGTFNFLGMVGRKETVVSLNKTNKNKTTKKQKAGNSYVLGYA